MTKKHFISYDTLNYNFFQSAKKITLIVLYNYKTSSLIVTYMHKYKSIF